MGDGSETAAESAGGTGLPEPAPGLVSANADPLAGYRLRTVRIGIWITGLTIAGLAGFAVLPGHPAINAAVYWPVMALAAASAVLVAKLPWPLLLLGPHRHLALYIWTVGDILLISVAVAVTGGGGSELWALYALPAIFFAGSYPKPGQAAMLALTAVGYALALAATGWDITASLLFVRVAVLALVYLMAHYLAKELRVEMELRAGATLRARLAEAQAQRAEWFRALVQDSGDIVTSFDIEGRILYMSAAGRELGYDPDQMVGTAVADLVHPDDLEPAIAFIADQFATGSKPAPLEYRGRHADGSWRYFEGVATNLLNDPTVNAVVVNARDVTERKRAELLLASQSEVLERIAAGAPLDTVLRLITEIVQEHAHALCTIAVNGAPGTQLMVASSDPRERVDGDDPSDAGWSRDIVTGDGTVLGAVRLRFANPRFATSDDQEVAAVAANLAAIALERDAAEARLAHQARHDSLTGLANRQVFVNTLEHALTSARTHETLAVLFVDLDGFKEINENMGHHVGDQVLVALGHRLAAALRMHDVIARLGGDEFVALCRVDGADQALHLASAILKRVQEPIRIGPNRISLDASIGVTLGSVFADEGPRWVVNAAWVQAAADELLRQADTAMFRAKELGGGRAELYAADPPPKPHLRAAGDSD